MNLRDKVIEIAKAQLGLAGPDGDDKFIAWYNEQTGAGFGLDDTPWCSIFVSWCLTQAGASGFPLTASCTNAMNWYKQRGRWHDADGSYSPTHGDIIYFNWSGDKGGDCDHVGMVTYLDDKVHTIEGNSADAVRERSYAYDSPYIRGYGVPKYGETLTPVQKVAAAFNLDSPDFWQDVIDGNKSASPEDINALFTKIAGKL